MSSYLQAFRQSIKHWYIPLIIGILLIVMGFYIFTVPLATYVTLALMFSISFIISGLLDIVFSIQNHKTLQGWGWYLVSGLLSFALGIYLITYPTISEIILPFVVGFAMLFRSFLLLGYSFDLRDLKVLRWGNLAILSILGILFSIMLISKPLFAGFTMVTMTAMTFVFVGIGSIILAFNLKKVKDYPDKISAELKAKLNDLQTEINNQLK